MGNLRRLALGEPQLAPVFFELGVLDPYYRDPRFRFEFEDFTGSICIASDHADSPELAERDKVFLQTFGIGYTQSKERVVVVYLRYLADLTPEHQQIWQARVISSPCNLNSDYARATIYGEWPQYNSVYRVFLTEQCEINKLARMIGKPDLFRRTYEEGRPDGFAPMLRPTQKNFEEFVHLLDKLLSENINKDFFKGDLPLEKKLPQADGSFETIRPGTLQLLEEWLSARFRSSTGEDVVKKLLAPLRDIRKLRQPKAHAVRTDAFDRSLPAKQDDLLGQATIALRSLRWALSRHPLARAQYKPPEWLDREETIVFY